MARKDIRPDTKAMGQVEADQLAAGIEYWLRVDRSNAEPLCEVLVGRPAARQQVGARMAHFHAMSDAELRNALNELAAKGGPVAGQLTTALTYQPKSASPSLEALSDADLAMMVDGLLDDALERQPSDVRVRDVPPAAEPDTYAPDRLETWAHVEVLGANGCGTCAGCRSGRGCDY